MYKLTLRVDDQLRSYLQSIFRMSDLERNEILQAMFYFGSQSKEYQQFLSNFLVDSPSLPFDGGLGTWILAKKTKDRIEGEECRHAVIRQLFGSGNSGLDRDEKGETREGINNLSEQTNTRGTVPDGVIHGKNDHGQEREISRQSREVCQSNNGIRGTTRISNSNGKTGTIKISF